MPRETLTDRKIQSLKPRAQKYIERDPQVPGHGIRVSPNGHKGFVLNVRYPGFANPAPRALGDYGELTLEGSRAKARQWRTLIKKGIDPKVQEERERQAALRQQHTIFGGVAEDFIKLKLPTERKGREVERDIRREFLPLWGKRPITEITPLDVLNVVKATVNRGAPYQAHNLLTTARRLFDWAIDQHVYGLETSPCDRLKPKAIIGKKRSRTRVLADVEWRALWKATEGLGYPYGPLFQMLSVDRPAQVRKVSAEAGWREVDLDHRVWVIPAERMKADAAHVVPLGDDVLQILKSLPRFKSGDYLFSSDFGVKPVNGFSKAKSSSLDAEDNRRIGQGDRTVRHPRHTTVVCAPD